MNEVLFFVTLLVTFTMVAVAEKYFGKTGLMAWVAFATVAANIEVAKCVDLFGLSVTLGNVTYGSVSLATDAINAKFGEKEARKGIMIGFLALVSFIVITQFGLLFQPNEQDMVAPAMKELFTLTPRICIASITAFVISGTLNARLFQIISKHTKRLWLKNNASTMCSQLIDSIIFTVIAFWGMFDAYTIVELIITTYAIKIIVAIIDTPFIYYIERK